MKRAALSALSQSKHAGQNHRLIGNETYRFSCHTTKTDHNISGPQLLNLQEVRVIDDTSDNVSHIIRLFLGPPELLARYSA